MTQLRKPVVNWVTGANVAVNGPSIGTVPDTGENPDMIAKALGVTGDESDTGAPAASANKPVWTKYRLDQGYTEDDLKGKTKEELMEMDDYEEDADSGDGS